MFRRLRAYRIPLAVLLAAMLLAAMLSVHLVGFNTGRALGHSVTVQVQGLAAGSETKVTLYNSHTTLHQSTRNGAAVFTGIAASTYSIYTDPNDSRQMAVGAVRVPAQSSQTVRMQPYYSVMVSVTGTNAPTAHSATLRCNGEDFHTSGAPLQGGFVALKAPVGTHEVQIFDSNGRVLATQSVTVSGDDVLADVVLGSATSTRNTLTVRVSSSGSRAANITLYDSSNNIAHSAWVQNGVAQFRDMRTGRYLVEAVGDGTGTSGYAIVNIPTSQDVTIQLTQQRKVDVDIRGNWASRASYINYSFGDRHMLYSRPVTISGKGDSVSLPAGSYRVYIYDSNKRLLESKSFRVSDSNVAVNVYIDSSSSSRSSRSSSNRWTYERFPATSSSRDTTPGSLTSSQAETLSKTAVSDAKRAGSASVVVRMKDIGSATRTTLRKIGANDDNLPVQLYVDSMSKSGKQVEVRIILDPALVDRAMNLYGSVTSDRAERILHKFQKWYANRMCVINLAQKDDWGQPVQIVAKLDLEKFNTANLYLYSYSSETNSYKHINNPECWIDSKGYLHFTTSLGGDIIVSNGPLRK